MEKYKVNHPSNLLLLLVGNKKIKFKEWEINHYNCRAFFNVHSFRPVYSLALVSSVSGPSTLPNLCFPMVYRVLLKESGFQPLYLRTGKSLGASYSASTNPEYASIFLGSVSFDESTSTQLLTPLAKLWRFFGFKVPIIKMHHNMETLY